MVGPDTRLLGAVAVWTAAAVAAVVAPVLWPLLVAALVGLAALVLWDAVLLRRTPAPQCERVLPARAFAGRAAEVCLRLHNPGRAVLICDVFDEAPADVRLDATALRQACPERSRRADRCQLKRMRSSGMCGSIPVPPPSWSIQSFPPGVVSAPSAAP